MKNKFNVDLDDLIWHWWNEDFGHIHTLIRCGKSARRKIVVEIAFIRFGILYNHSLKEICKKLESLNGASLCLYRQRPTMHSRNAWFFPLQKLLA